MNIYLITNLKNSKQYIGREKHYNSNYYGSGKLIIEAIKKYGKQNFRKEILISDEYIDTWKECSELEASCKLSFNTITPEGYNKTCWEWPIPVEFQQESGRGVGKQNKELKRGWFAPGMASKGGKISSGKNFVKWQKEHPKEFLEHVRRNGKIIGKRMRELRKGVFAPENLGKGGKRTKELKRGIFAPENLGKGGKRSYELKVGWFAPGMASMGGKKAAETHKRLGTGLYDPKIQSIGGKIGGKISGKLHAYTLFETDEILQQMTLGQLLRL